MTRAGTTLAPAGDQASRPSRLYRLSSGGGSFSGRNICAVEIVPAQFWRGFFALVVRVWTSATGRLTVLVVVIAGRVPLLPSVAV